MFTYPKIFSQFPELIAYVGSRDFLMQPKQFHSESPTLQKNVQALEESFGFKKAFFLAQCHSTDFIEITEKNQDEMFFADACVTKLQNISLNIVTADCVPILLYDTVQKTVGVIHAGWKGSAGNILGKTIETLKEKYGSDMKDIFLYIGPSICGKCYEVGREVAEYFPNSRIEKGEKYFLDLRNENLLQALYCKIPRENIQLSEECTFEFSEKYFSYRREKSEGRFVCGIGMK